MIWAQILVRSKDKKWTSTILHKKFGTNFGFEEDKTWTLRTKTRQFPDKDKNRTNYGHFKGYELGKL